MMRVLFTTIGCIIGAIMFGAFLTGAFSPLATIGFLLGLAVVFFFAYPVAALFLLAIACPPIGILIILLMNK